MNIEYDYRIYKEIMEQKGRKPITLKQFSKMKEYENQGQRIAAKEANIAIEDVVLVMIIMSGNDEKIDAFLGNETEQNESLDKNEQEYQADNWSANDDIIDLDNSEDNSEDNSSDWDSSSNSDFDSSSNSDWD
jgi:hypothetical protein